MELFEILSAVSVVNKDDGICFTNTRRLEAAADLLRNSNYRRIEADGLFHLYSKLDLVEMRTRSVTVVSSHIDCAMSRCFSEKSENGLLKGTFDNAITNAAILSLMLSDSLSDDVVVVFTGDEERNSHGALDFTEFMRENDVRIKHLFVLDVTDMGWDENCDFTIENNFWHNNFGGKIVNLAKKMPYEWRFVPSDPDDVPAFVPEQKLIPEEAEPDESWEYDEYNVNCCSICIPVKGAMHSNDGVYAREKSFENYTKALNEFLQIK